jgi:hypothetical protein
MGRIIITFCKFWTCRHFFKTACFHFVFISGIWLWRALLNIIFSYWIPLLTLQSLNGTKCTQAWSFLQNSHWYKVTDLPVFCHFFEVTSIQNSHYAGVYCFLPWSLFSPLNPTGPSTKDRKMDWKCYHCLELVCQDHFNKKFQITCNSCKEQS